MIEWTLAYLASQILTIIIYICLCSTYFFKSRKKILVLNVVAHNIQIIAFLLLGGLTGAAMNAIYVARDLFLVADEKNNQKSDKITKRDIGVLICFIILILVMTIFTYDGWASLLSVIATIISTFAVWQKSTKVYKMLGIPISGAWLGYHISLNSIFAIILESILLISTISGYILEVNKSKKENIMIEIKFDKDNNKSIAYDNNTRIGECDFIELEEIWNIVHTEVSSLYQGQGIARKLVENIIENAKKYNKKLIADCSYAKKVIDKN